MSPPLPDGLDGAGVSQANGPELEPLLTDWAGRAGKAVIFDFNGTLSNDEGLLLRLYTDLFRERLAWTLSPDDYRRRFAGRSDREIIAAVVTAVGGGEALVQDLLAERRQRYRQMVEDNSPIVDATAETVALLAAAGVPLGIVTGAQRPDVELVLSCSPLGGLFDVVVTEEDVTAGKPDPEGFLRASEALDRPVDSILVLEDSPPGVRAAKAASMRCIAVTGTVAARDLSEADAVIEAITPGLFVALSLAGAARVQVGPLERPVPRRRQR